ncbi:uncharacterized protein METZ01_LOCUS201352 [marine metagenome]|uniref:Uncharacterized protein n=1 Tax=marine metagenome TaxID=408172 RepID=A0A382ECT9_9ZZZZ
MKNRKTYIPITLAELTNVTQSFSTSLEQIEYLAVTILGLQNKTNENDDNELILEMIKFAENEIKNLGGRPVTWLKYPLVTNVHDYNELKGRLKDDGKLLEWVKFQYNNIERSDQEHDGILGWRFNDRVLRQAELDSTEKDGDDDEGFSQLLWEALDLSDDFVDHLERQLKTDTDLLTSTPENKHASVAVSFDTPENDFFENSGEKSIGKTSPITFFIDEQIKEGEQVWQEAWSKLFKQAQKKLTDNEELTIWHIGEFSVFLRKAFKQTSKGHDHAVEYQEGESEEWKKVVRQSFGSMFRRAMKISRTQSDSPK